MKEKRTANYVWKEKNLKLWEKMVLTYLVLRSSPSIKLIFKLLSFFLRSCLSIIVKKIFSHFFK